MFLIKFSKLLLIVITAVFVLLALALAVVRFNAQIALSLGNQFSPYRIKAEQASLTLRPLTIILKQAELSDQNGKTLAEFGNANIGVDWVGALHGQANVWRIVLADGEINLRPFFRSETSTALDPNTTPGTKLNVHRMLSPFNVSVRDVRLRIDAHQSINLVNVKSTYKPVKGSAEHLADYQTSQQTRQMALVYQSQRTTLPINVAMHSQINQGLVDIDLEIQALDLSDLLSPNDSTQKSVSNEADQAIESEINWSWLNLINPTRINISTEQLSYQDKQLNELETTITLDQTIQFKLNTKANISLSDDHRLNDDIAISAQLRPISTTTTQQDVTADIELRTSILALALNGGLNLNGVHHQNMTAHLSVIDYPLDTTATIEPIRKNFFPMNGTFEFNSNPDSNRLSITELRFGKSDLQGNAEVFAAQNEQPLRVVATLTSDTLTLSNEPQADQTSTATTQDDSVNTLLSDEAIAFDWLESIELDFDLSVSSLRLNKLEFSDVRLPLQIKQQRLDIPRLTSNFANGVWVSSLSLTKQQTAPQLEFTSSLENAVLEKMGLFAKEQVSQGNTRFDTKLTAIGNNTRQFASSLSGHLLLEIEEGVLGNDSFEVIGSDLFSELLSKLNPFIKSDPSTKLKCAVANLKIEQGKALVDKSLAVQTSKLSIVANGKIDLGNETLKLKAVPSAENGLGIGIGTLVKSVSIGGTLSKPVLYAAAGDVLKSGVAIGAALSTGGASLLADGLIGAATEPACKRAKSAKFN